MWTGEKIILQRMNNKVSWDLFSVILTTNLIFKSNDFYVNSDQFGPPSPASLSSIWNHSCAAHFLALTVSAVSFMQIPQVQEFLVLYNFSIPILRVRSLWWPKEMKVGRHISRYYYCLSLITPQKSMMSILKTGCSEV